MEGRHKRVGQGFVPKIVLVWCLLLVAAYGAASYFVASTISSERAAAIQRHEDRLDPASSEAGRTSEHSPHRTAHDSHRAGFPTTGSAR